MYAFEYHRPSSSKEALDLAAKKSEGRFLAGGQSLVQAMKLRLSAPSDLIDLSGLTDLKALKAEGSTVVVGAMVRHAEVAASSAVQKAIPALAQLAGRLRSAQHQDREQPQLRVVQAERLVDQVLVLDRAGRRPARQRRPLAPAQAVERRADRRLVVVHHRIAVGRLIARQPQRVERERVPVRRRALLLHQAGDDPDLDGVRFHGCVA